MSDYVRAQIRACGCFLQLLAKARELGWEPSKVEWYRDPRWAAQLADLGVGSSPSLHSDGMAVDLYMWRGDYQAATYADYEPLARWWQAQGFAWGGNFTGKRKGDVRHFSIPYGGLA
jgi:hypothetical protein